MDPKLLLPILAVGFAVAAALRWQRARRIDPAARTWLTIAVLFALVSAWLHWVA